ncbi:putative galactose-1-phosphate uridylyltransferase-like [Sesbania bispinosa]|nr:putative galactose-1-phosphate uridylyltransferase-like [Sesbania bispinosa]
MDGLGRAQTVEDETSPGCSGAWRSTGNGGCRTDGSTTTFLYDKDVLESVDSGGKTTTFLGSSTARGGSQ